MNTVADRLGAINQEKQQLKSALEAMGVNMSGVPFTQYASIINLLV